MENGSDVSLHVDQVTADAAQFSLCALVPVKAKRELNLRIQKYWIVNAC